MKQLTDKQYTEKYNAKERTADPNKIEVNKIVGKLAHDRRNKKMIILDSEKLLSLKTLVNNEVPFENIYIPNPYAYTKIKKHHRNTFNMLLGTFINTHTSTMREEIGLSFFDYMCCLDGNSDVHPIQDIKDYFKYKLPADNSILAVTLSFRGGPIKKGRTYNETCRTDMLVGYSALENGYYSIKLDLGFAYNGLYVSFYKILKQPVLRGNLSSRN